LDVLRDVDDHRAGAPRRGDLERLVQDVRQVVDVLNQVVVLGARAGDADRVALLEGVGADEVRRHLAGHDHQGDGIHQGVDDAGDGVGGAGAGSDQHHARPAGGAGVALGGMGGALLVAHEDVVQLRLVEDGVIDRQHGAAGIAEEVRHPLVDEGPHDDLGAGHGGGGGLGGRFGVGGVGVGHGLIFKLEGSFGQEKRPSEGPSGSRRLAAGRKALRRDKSPYEYERDAHRSAP
jgi:hypothetical protein